MSESMEITYQSDVERNDFYQVSGTAAVEISRNESFGILELGNHLLDGIAEKFIDPVKYAETVRSYRNDAAVDKYLRQTGYFIENNGEIPFYVDIPVTGEIAYMCDRWIWQSEIFFLFVYFRNEGSRLQFSKIWKWLTQQQRIIRIDHRLARKSRFVVEGRLYAGTMAKHALLQYLLYLSYLGFIRADGYLKYNHSYAVEARTFCAPVKRYEVRFRRLLSDGSLRYGSHGPAVDRIIEEALFE
ncbi:MAG: hypothetical protein ACYC5K_08395 [Saccharofermentanales bacterium]